MTSLRAEEQTERPIISEESGKAPEEVALNPTLQEAPEFTDRDGAERGFLASMVLVRKAGLSGAWRRLECPDEVAHWAVTQCPSAPGFLREFPDPCVCLGVAGVLREHGPPCQKIINTH